MIELSGETKIPNWMLALFILGLTSGWGILGGVIIQDRGQVHRNTDAIGKEATHRAETDGEFKRQLAAMQVKMDDFNAMLVSMNKTVNEVDRKMDRLMP